MQTIVNSCLASLCCKPVAAAAAAAAAATDGGTNPPTSLCDIIQSIIDDTALVELKATTDANQASPSPPSVFKLPISYLAKDDQHALAKPIVDDLELIDAKDAVATRPLYARVTGLSDDSVFGKQFLYLWSETFTSNVDYLRNTQHFIANLRRQPMQPPADGETSDKQIETFWKSMKTDRVGFKDKFGYIDAPPFPIIEKLNTIPSVLQILSIYNVSSPLISLMMPVLLLIVPFFILKSRGADISLEKYVDVLKMLASSHAIGKLFTEFDSVGMEKKLYIMMSVAFYFLQVYQNSMSCYRFYKNVYLIHDHLIMVRAYLRQTISKMERVLASASGLLQYTAFSSCLEAQMQGARDICEELADIEPFTLCMDCVSRIGHVMKYYYMFFNDAEVDHMMRYAFGFSAYYEHLCGIIAHIESGTFNPCTFHVAGEAGEQQQQQQQQQSQRQQQRAITTMTDAYFMNTVSAAATATVVKNDITLDRKIIITGPNAAGKTTIIKTAIFNIILSQQIGYGAYSSAIIAPYQFLHCYLNIPDTSGRDSLFQAESRRCKEILDCIIENPSKRHFCIFDELYSGTNPYEAVASAYGYINYISGMRNVDFMLTTHYIQLCKLFRGARGASASGRKGKDGDGKGKHGESSGSGLLERNNNVRNLHMETSVNNTFDYTYHYKIVNGISKIKGGIKVLFDLKYPDAIIKSTKTVLEL